MGTKKSPERRIWATNVIHSIAKFEVNQKAMEAKIPQGRNKDILIEVVKIARRRDESKLGVLRQSGSLPALRAGHRPQSQQRLRTESLAKTLPNLNRPLTAEEGALGSPHGRVDIGVDLRFVFPRAEAFRDTS